MNAPKLSFVDVDLTYGVEGALLGISGFEGICERGPFGRPDILISSWTEFRKLYGNLLSTSNFPLICKRVLDRGGKLRVSRVGHYTNVSDPATLDYVKAGAVTFKTAAPVIDVFKLQPKYPGAAYNQLKANVLAASNGNVDYFNLEIFLANDKTTTYELYQNLTVPGKPTAEASTYLNDVKKRSLLVDVTYMDVSAATQPVVRPTNVNGVFLGGTDSAGVLSPADYVGSASAKTGLYSFDIIDDVMQVATPDNVDTVVISGGMSYADARGDLHYWAHLDPDTAANLVSDRAAVTFNSPYGAFFSGGIKVLDDTGTEKTISEIGDVAGVAAYIDTIYGPWNSFSNTIKGRIPNAIGVGVNYGSAGSYNDLNNLANHQIQMVVQDGTGIHVSGNYTAQLASSKRSFLNIMRGIVYIKKSLKPSLLKYLGEPTDFVTFKAMFNEVQPFFDSLVDKRFLYKDGWRWQGDQDATNMDELQVNTPEDLDQGIYKVRLFLKPITALQEIIVEITISPSDVNFEDIDNEANI